MRAGIRKCSKMYSCSPVHWEPGRSGRNVAPPPIFLQAEQFCQIKKKKYKCMKHKCMSSVCVCVSMCVRVCACAQAQLLMMYACSWSVWPGDTILIRPFSVSQDASAQGQSIRSQKRKRWTDTSKRKAKARDHWGTKDRKQCETGQGVDAATVGSDSLGKAEAF